MLRRSSCVRRMQQPIPHHREDLVPGQVDEWAPDHLLVAPDHLLDSYGQVQRLLARRKKE